MAEQSTTASLLAMKCPKCHEGNMFKETNPYNLRHMYEMPEDCPCCGQSFQPEPGFYYGAMYVNYGFGVVLFVLAYVILEILLGVPSYVFFGVYLGVLLLFGPLMFRYSRVIYLYMFVRYDEKAIEKHQKHN
jgi:uncharacterized protein (DUF983 family)